MRSKSSNYFISAGEPSGDLLGGDLVEALKSSMPGYQAHGVVGTQMRLQGVHPLADISDLSVMGFVEVIKQLPRLKRLEKRLLSEIDRLQPDFAVLIDYPGFHLRLAKSLKLRKIKVFQYVAPQLWAWGAKRVAKLRAVTDAVLGIMPFEGKFFQDHGVNYTYVGTPQVDRALPWILTDGGTKKKWSFAFDQGPVLAFFPGSRMTEVRRILPVMLMVADLLPDKTAFVLSLAESISPEAVVEIFEKCGKKIVCESMKSGDLIRIAPRWHVLVGDSLKLMASADAALVASGTATLECALVQTPMAVIYRMHPLSWQIAKRVVTVTAVSLANLVAGKKVVKEFLQDIDCQEVADHLSELLYDSQKQQEFRGEVTGLAEKLRGTPHDSAAKFVKDFMMQI